MKFHFSHTKVYDMHECYDIDHRIGFGGFSVIYLARRKKGVSESFPELVAMKKIQKSKLPMHHIWQEISIMKQFSHPNILQLYDVLETHDDVTLILEYCNGGDLSNLKEDELSNDDLLFDIISQILTGWKYVKGLDKQLIHRDIKLQNILIHRKANGRLVIKIADFGFCMTGQTYAIKQQKMMEMTMCGSPYYMAPEMFHSATTVLDQYDDRIDIWSLGIIIYKLLNGIHRHPLGDIHDIQTLISLYHDPAVHGEWQMKLEGPSCTCGNTLCTRCFLYVLMKGMLEISREHRLSWDEIFHMICCRNRNDDDDVAHYHMPIYENYYNPRIYNKNVQTSTTIVDISYYQKRKQWYSWLGDMLKIE